MGIQLCMDDRVGVLFVCMGNICRSPMAESVFRHLADEAGVADRLMIDSAGTHSYHLGHRPHPETQRELRAHDIEVGDGVSRLVTDEDFERFHYILAMDRDNLADLTEHAQRCAGGDAIPEDVELRLLLDHAPVDEGEVPDPYYEGGYDHVYGLVHAGCTGLLAHICREESLSD